MKFEIDRIKRLYKDYYRLFILTDEPKYNTHIDIGRNEFIDLYIQMTEIIEMDSLNVGSDNK